MQVGPGRAKQRVPWSLLRRAALLTSGLVVGGVQAAPPAGAHGVTAHGSLPFPTWQVAWGGVIVVALGWSLLALVWHRRYLAGLAAGRSLPLLTPRVTRMFRCAGAVIGVAAWTSVVVVGLFGSQHGSANIAPLAVKLLFWLAMCFISSVVGNVWAPLDPLRTFSPAIPPSHGSGSGRHGTSWPWPWLPMIGLASYLWLELASPWAASPRVLAGAVVAYTALMVGVSWRRGGQRWLAEFEPFAVFFGTLGRGGAFAARDRLLIVRPPLRGLAAAPLSAPALGAVLAVLGGMVFDGFSGTRWWLRLVGGETAGVRSITGAVGISGAIGVVAVLWLAASYVADAPTNRNGRSPLLERAVRDAPVLVPITVAWVAAHGISSLAFEGQNLLVQLSDPLGRGWNLFGTIDRPINYQVLSARTLAVLQLAVLACGHLAALVIGRELALARHGPVVPLRSQSGVLAVATTSMAAAVLLLVGS